MQILHLTNTRRRLCCAQLNRIRMDDDDDDGTDGDEFDDDNDGADDDG